MYTRRLQDLGLNAYESRAYLVLIGHSQFKALEVAGQANIPRQKIYEVLDSLIEKGFVRVVQGKAKQYSAVDPEVALNSYLGRKKEAFEREWQDRKRLAELLNGDLAEIFTAGNLGKGPLQYLRIVADTAQIADEYRKLLLSCEEEYVEFARPPYGVDPVGEPLIKQLLEKRSQCRLLFDSRVIEDAEHRDQVEALQRLGADVRLSVELPLKLALFDRRRGMISLDDPVVTHPQITALVFDHQSMASAMVSMFDDFWKRSRPL